jgi:hypothetical protein
MECNLETFGCKRASTRGFTNEARNLLILLPSLSLSHSHAGLAKVEKCVSGVRTSPQKEEDHTLIFVFFQRWEKWIKWKNSMPQNNKQTEGIIHTQI